MIDVPEDIKTDPIKCVLTYNFDWFRFGTLTSVCTWYCGLLIELYLYESSDTIDVDIMDPSGNYKDSLQIGRHDPRFLELVNVYNEALEIATVK